MKELIVQGPGQLAWVEAPDPQLTTPGSALVRPIASASCDLDRRLIAGTTPFKPPFANPAEVAKSVDKIIADKAAAPAETAPAPSIASSIFPNAGNSAPVTSAVVQPAASPKSLFANLQRPTNTPTTH